MRLTRLQTGNIGGLRDCDIRLPDQSLIAFAGANGTGKSKLLACLLAPWTRSIPRPVSHDITAHVIVDIEFDDIERTALEEFNRQSGLNQRMDAPRTIRFMFTDEPLVEGTMQRTDPGYVPARDCFVNPAMLQQVPSLDLLYVPAERRLLPPGSNIIDLSQLGESVGQQHLEDARYAVQKLGYLDDQEFETYAKALCVAGALPGEDDTADHRGGGEQTRWVELKSAVDSLLFPKTLLPLTREHPNQLRIGLPTGGWHTIQDLSSGERQALIIISRVFRAGEGHSLVAIDEPDAYLHPTLSARLLRGILRGLEGGRLIVATHSPAILDSIPPEAIFGLSYQQSARVVETEDERLALYREAGFRASALTQAEVLMVTEGQTDSIVLPALIPDLGGASIRAVGGRAQVIQTLHSLVSYETPIVGVVDADVQAEEIPAAVGVVCHEWSVADLEAVLLSSDSALTAAIEGLLIKDEYRSVDTLRNILDEMLMGFKNQAIAEVAQRRLRTITNVMWPSPRGESALSRLRDMADRLPQLDAETIDSAISEAEREWSSELPRPWRLVRGKWLIGRFAQRVSSFHTGEALLKAIAARQPEISDVGKLAALIKHVRSKHLSDPAPSP